MEDILKQQIEEYKKLLALKDEHIAFLEKKLASPTLSPLDWGTIPQTPFYPGLVSPIIGPSLTDGDLTIGPNVFKVTIA